MSCPTYKIDSNDTGLRFAIEKCLRELPSTSNVPPDADDPVWFPLEPNSYGDVGSTITTVARDPINPSRQRQKGVVTDLEASASFQMDLLSFNHLYMLQAFAFALPREKPTTNPLNGAGYSVTTVDGTTGYAVDNAFVSQLSVNDLILAEGFGVSANNGLKVVTTVGTGNFVASGSSAEATPPAGAKIRVVGFQFPSADVQITTPAGQHPRLVSTSVNMSSLGLIPGEWIYIGGDVASNHFTNNQGFARIGQITTTYLSLDKVSWASPTAEAGTGKSIRIFFGTVIRNEDDPDLIVRTPLQFERTLGNDADGVMSQYIIGSIANEFTLNVPQAEKVTAEMAFVACDAVARSGADGLKAGSRPALVTGDAFNTSSDVRRLSFSMADEVEPLFVYATDLTLTINNNASGAKAIGVLGNFDINVGVLDVSGSVTAYFQDIRAVNAVRNNEDVSMDLIMVKNNTGLVWDIPLMALGNGMVTVEKDQAITVPLDMMAAQSSFGHTFLYVNFPYLPNAA